MLQSSADAADAPPTAATQLNPTLLLHPPAPLKVALQHAANQHSLWCPALGCCRCGCCRCGCCRRPSCRRCRRLLFPQGPRQRGVQAKVHIQLLDISAHFHADLQRQAHLGVGIMLCTCATAALPASQLGAECSVPHFLPRPVAQPTCCACRRHSTSACTLRQNSAASSTWHSCIWVMHRGVWGQWGDCGARAAEAASALGVAEMQQARRAGMRLSRQHQRCTSHPSNTQSC